MHILLGGYKSGKDGEVIVPFVALNIPPQETKIETNLSQIKNDFNFLNAPSQFLPSECNSNPILQEHL